MLGIVQLSIAVCWPTPGWRAGSGVQCSLWPCAHALCNLQGPALQQGAGLLRVQATRALTSPLSLQQAANIVRALELFVRPDLLGGANAYMCAR